MQQTSIGKFCLSIGLASLSATGFLPATLVGVSTIAIVATPSPVQAAILSTWEFNPSSQELTIMVPGGTTPRFFLAAEPARIVVELPNTDIGTVATQQSYGGAVQTVRVGQVEAGVTRIVMELAPGTVLAPGHVELRQVGDGGSSDRWVIRPLLATDASIAMNTPVDAANQPPTSLPEGLEATPSQPSSLSSLPPLEPGATEIPVVPPATPDRPSPSAPAPAASTPAIPPIATATPEAVDIPVPTLDPTDSTGSIGSTESGIESESGSESEPEVEPEEDVESEVELEEVEPEITAAEDEPEVEPEAVEIEAADRAISSLQTALGTTIEAGLEESETEEAELEESGTIQAELEESELEESETENSELEESELEESETIQAELEEAELEETETEEGNPQENVAARESSPAILPPPVFPPSNVPSPIADNSSNSFPAPDAIPSGFPPAEPTLPSTPAAPVAAPAAPVAAAPAASVAPAAPVAPASSSSTSVSTPPPTGTASRSSTEPIAFGEPIPQSAFSTLPALSPGAISDLPASPSSAAMGSINRLLPSGTVLNLRYSGEAPIELVAGQSRQEVLLLNEAVEDASGNVVLPQGSYVIGRFETKEEGSLFIAQAISFQGRNLLIQAQSEMLSGRQLQEGNLLRNSALGVAAGLVLGGITGIGLIPAIAAGAATSAATTYITSSDAAVIQPEQVLEVRLTEDLTGLN